MSTRLADLTQYRAFINAYPGGRFSKDGSMYYLPDDFVGDRINPPKPISSELLESVQVFNEPEITIGPIPHPDNDRCPDSCDSKLIHGLYRDDRDNGVYGEKYRKPLTATVPTDGKTQRKHTASLLNAMQFCGINSWRPTGTDEQGCFINDAVPFGKLSHEDALKIVGAEPLTDRSWFHFWPGDVVGDRVPSIPVDDLFRKCSHCNGSLPPMEPMTLERAVTVLNEQRYLGFDDWDSGFMVDRFSVAPVCKVGADASKNYVIEWQYFRTEFEAIACAEKLVREK